MNIQLARDGTKAILKITLPVPEYDVRVFSFTFECQSEVYAGLLTKEIRNQLQNEIQAIRQDEYAAGWKDKSARKSGPRSWFACALPWRNSK